MLTLGIFNLTNGGGCKTLINSKSLFKNDFQAFGSHGFVPQPPKLQQHRMMENSRELNKFPSAGNLTFFKNVTFFKLMTKL